MGCKKFPSFVQVRRVREGVVADKLPAGAEGPLRTISGYPWAEVVVPYLMERDSWLGDGILGDSCGSVANNVATPMTFRG